MEYDSYFFYRLLIAIFIFCIIYYIADYYKQYLDIQKDNLTNLINNQIALLSYYSIIIVGVIAALLIIGIEFASIITIIASLTIIIGLAFQNLLSNMFSGLYIVINNLYEINDDVELKPLSFCKFLKGRIFKFNLFYTEIINEDDNIQIIPNSLIQNNILINLSKK